MNARRGAIRWSYLIALMSFLGWVSSSLTGGWAYFYADGMVLGDPSSVAPEYTVTVREMLVREGQEVKKGDVVAVVDSTRIADVTARLMISSSVLSARLAEAQAKAKMSGKLEAAAQSRETVTSESDTVLSDAKARAIYPTTVKNLIAESSYRGKQDAAQLRAEKEAQDDQLEALMSATTQNDRALTQIARFYNGGRMAASVDGTVSAVLFGPGGVVREGEAIIELVGKQRYVLAYFPVGRWYDLAEGRRVRITPAGGLGFTNGHRAGRITKINNVAAIMPREFQRSLTPVERGQLVRIDFDADQTLPYFTKVTIR